MMKRKKGKKPGPPIKPGPCPFCGENAAKVGKWRDSDDAPAVFMIDCEACCANGPVMGGNSGRAKAAWNYRGGPPDTFSAANRGTPESVYGEETEEEKDRREAEGFDPAVKIEKPTPCPFCAGVEVYVESGTTPGRKKEPYWYTFCGTCDACGPAHDTSDGFAVLGWNKRFP
jgi:hypothetical protein